MNSPLVSIVIPTLNAGRFIKEALESIKSQTYNHYEIIIVDAGSTDNTHSIIQDFPISAKVLQQESQGLAGAWNEGILASTGKYISLIDSDDKWNNHCLESHIKLLSENPELSGTVGHVKFFLHKENEIPSGFKTSLLKEKQLAYMPGCFVCKKEVYQQIGLFEERWKIISDIVWFDKLKKSAEKLGIIDEVVLNKRVHLKNLSYTTAETPIYNQELLKYLFELRKNQANNPKA